MSSNHVNEQLKRKPINVCVIINFLVVHYFFRLDSFPADDELVPDELVKACAIVTGSKWEDIGMLLGISDSNLDDIRGSTSSSLARMIKVLDLWRKREGSPTVRKLLGWFEQVDVNRRAIERKFDELDRHH